MPELWYTARIGFLKPLVPITQVFAKGCEDIIGRRGGDMKVPAVAKMTQNVVSSREGTELCRISYRLMRIQAASGVDLSGVHQHDRDVVLNGVHTAAFGAFQAIPIGIQNHRLFANRADQHVKQILRNHNGSIVALSGARVRADAFVRPGGAKLRRILTVDRTHGRNVFSRPMR